MIYGCYAGKIEVCSVAIDGNERVVTLFGLQGKAEVGSEKF